MSDEDLKDLQSKQRQLAEARENLRLIEERKAEHVLQVDVPLYLIKEERSLREHIAQLEADVAAPSVKSDPPSTLYLRALPPAPPHHFTGREEDLAKFVQLLTSGENVAMTALHGMGGIGKTSLALKLAERIAAHFPGGVLWRSLGPNPDVITALDVWAQQADPRSDLTGLPTAVLRAEIVRGLLAPLGRLCVIIDDVWDAESFNVLKSAVPPGCPILITTRDSDLAKSLRCRVERIDTLSDNEAVALLVNLLGPLNEHEDAACDIAHLTEGLPLALELIAGLADSPADLPALAQKLRTRPTLDVLKRGTTREQSIEACFTLSYEHLNADLQRRFRVLGVFAPAPFDRDAIAAVWGDDDDDAVDDAIRLLVRRSLLSKDDAAQEYKQHALLHDFAVRLLNPLPYPPPSEIASTGEGAATPSPVRGPLEEGQSTAPEERTGEGWEGGSRHAAYYRRFAKEQNWRAVEHFFDQIDHGWQWVQKNEPEQIIDYVFAVHDFLSDRGRNSERLEWLNVGLTQARAAKDRKNEGIILNNVGGLYTTLGQLDEALSTYQMALNIHCEVGNRLEEGPTLNNIGVVYRERGQYDKALDFYEQSLAVRREVDDRSGESDVLANIGTIYQSRGLLMEAFDIFQQVLAIHRKMGNRAAVSTVLHNIALNYDLRGQKLEALDIYQKSLALCREVGDRSGEGKTLTNIGEIYQAWGQMEKALDIYNEALIIYREVGDRSGECVIFSQIGLICQASNQLQEALDIYHSALAISREIGLRPLESKLLNNIGGVYGNLGQITKALEFHQQAIVVQQEIGDRSGEGTTLNNIGVVYRAQGQMEQALDVYYQALDFHREVGNRWQESITLFNIGVLLDEMGRTAEAVEYFEQNVALDETIGHPDLESDRAKLERIREKLAKT